MLTVHCPVPPTERLTHHAPSFDLCRLSTPRFFSTVYAAVFAADDGQPSARLKLESNLPLGTAAALSTATFAAASAHGQAVCGARLAEGADLITCLSVGDMGARGAVAGVAAAGDEAGSVFVTVQGAGELGMR